VFTALAGDACEVARELLVPVITAETSRRERTEILDRFREGRYRVIVSARVLNEGIDVPDARVAILLAGRLGLREHVQRIGRVLRPSPGKRALVYELVTAGTIDDRRANARRRQLALGS
jgi:superfamily II DNA or RNA helicase